MFSHFLRKLWPVGRPAAGPAVSAGGLAWRVLPDAADVFGPGGPDLARWLADGTAEQVKHGPHRTVYRVRLPGGTVYAKHCRVGGFRAWAREVLRPAKARLEFENALALRDMGVPAVRPLAWGCRRPGWPGESYLVTLERGGVPFLHFLEAVFPTLPAADRPAVRQRLARSLGAFMARLHGAGVAHPDPHPGNLLVELSASGEPRFCLIDLHAVRFGRPLSWAARRANLVLWNRWFQLRATRTDRLRFWHAYQTGQTTEFSRTARGLPSPLAGEGRGEARGVRGETPAPGTLDPSPPAPLPQGERGAKPLARQVETDTLTSNRRFWAGRESRCVGTNRYFRRVRRGPVAGFAVRDLPESVLAPLLADPDAVFARPGVALFKDSRTSTVAAFTLETPDGPREVVWKRFRVRHGSELVKNLFRRSPALRSWVAGHSLRDRWLPTPRPLLYLRRKRHGLPAEGYLLTERVPDAVGLPEAVTALSPDPARPTHGGRRVLRLWAARIARTVRTLHDHAGSHRDLKAANVLLQGAATDPTSAVPVFVDLVGVRTGRVPSVRQRAKELARLNASFLNSPLVNRTERLRFLLAYLRAGLGGGTRWKDWWRLVAAATSTKVQKNRRRGRPLA